MTRYYFILLTLIYLLVNTAYVHADMYFWADESGKKHLTNKRPPKGAEIIRHVYDKSEVEYEKEFIPSEGLVPDEQTAISIAVAVWSPIYGQDNIAKQKPYQVFLVDGYWVVSGSLPKRMVGGTAKIVISREDGRIINISHDK